MNISKIINNSLFAVARTVAVRILVSQTFLGLDEFYSQLFTMRNGEIVSLREIDRLHLLLSLRKIFKEQVK